MQDLTHILYLLSTALLVPVLVGLLFLTGSVLMALGGFARECWERRCSASARSQLLSRAACTSPERHARELDCFFSANGGGAGYLAHFCTEAAPVRGHPIEVRRLLDEVEIDVARRLSHLVLGARVGPMLGLMGTLIPLGPALIGLAEGKIDELAANLVLAFSTTVVGLLAGVLSYAMLHARRNWYASDLGLLEYVCEALESREQA